MNDARFACWKAEAGKQTQSPAVLLIQTMVKGTGRKHSQPVSSQTLWWSMCNQSVGCETLLWNCYRYTRVFLLLCFQHKKVKQKCMLLTFTGVHRTVKMFQFHINNLRHTRYSRSFAVAWLLKMHQMLPGYPAGKSVRLQRRILLDLYSLPVCKADTRYGCCYSL